MRRPAREINNFELFSTAGFRENCHGAQDHVTAQGSRFCSQRTGFAHAPQIFQKLQGIVIRYAHLVDVRDGQSETCPLKRRAVVTHAGEGRNPRRRAAGEFGFRSVEGCTQCVERFLSENSSDKQSVGL